MAADSSGQTCWYRVVGSGRRTQREVLRSGGGRFHDDPDREPTAYVAESLLTAWCEVKAHAGEARINARALRAWRIVIPEAVAKRLVDLRASDQQQLHHITPTGLQADPAPESGKALARRLRQEGKSGILYRSVRNRPGVCVAVFLEDVEPELGVEPADAEWERFIQEEEGE